MKEKRHQPSENSRQLNQPSREIKIGVWFALSASEWLDRSFFNVIPQFLVLRKSED